MENQMKICFISRDQYQKIWHKTMPQDRFCTDLPTLALLSRNLNALFVVGDAVDFISNAEDIVNPDWLK